MGARVESGGTVDCLCAEVFASFEGEVALFCELLGSFGEGLESMERMRRNDYCNLLAALDVSCSVFDYDKKTGKTMGGGDTKIYLAATAEGFCPSSQLEHQRALSLPKAQPSSAPPEKPSSVLSQDKLPGDFLGELLRLRQEFEENTGKVGGLLSFRDCGEPEEASHI